VNTSKITIRTIIVAVIILGALIFAGRRVLIKHDVTVAQTSSVKVDMPTIQVLWHLGPAHHKIDSTYHDSWWWTYSEGEGAPAKYFNVVFKYGSVVEIADTADFARPQLLRDDEAPLPKKKVEPQR
jgi:hypothetical protein